MWRRGTNTRGRRRLGLCRSVAMAGAAGVLGAGSLYVALAPQPAAGGAPPTIERVSVASNGDQGNDRSLLPATNADASIVAFKSSASNLVPDDRNQKVDIFVRDRGQQLTERVSVSDIPGTQPNDNSFPPALDHSGNVVAFASLASNILIGDFNLGADVFVYNRVQQTTSVLTLVYDQFGNGRGGGGAPDLRPSVTADGGLIAFTAAADDLVPKDANETNDVFVRSPDGGPVELISVISSGSQAGHSGNGPSAGPAISADGCLVAFYSDASNLVSGDTNGFRDVFVRDRCAGTTERVSVSTGGEQANRPSQAAGFSVAISADGRFVAFSSDASNLDEGDDNNTTDIFVRDREAGTTTRISKNQAGDSANGPSQFPGVSGDGRFVVFQSAASNLVDNDTNGRTDIFVVDTTEGSIDRVSLTSSGDQANGDSNSPQISVNGATVVFQSDASNLVPDDTNGVTDCFAAVNPLVRPVTPTITPTSTSTPPPTVTMTGTMTMTVTPTTTPTTGPGTPTVTPTATMSVTLTPTGLAISPTPTSTGTHANTATPTPSRTITVTPGGGTQTPTATRTSTPGPPSGSSGGCSCRIDGTQAPNDWGMIPALGLPLLLWLARNRRRRIV
jgi:Tol biopolymer transport system component